MKKAGLLPMNVDPFTLKCSRKVICLFIICLFQGAVDDMTQCTTAQGPQAEGNSATGRPQHQGAIFLTFAHKGLK